MICAPFALRHDTRLATVRGFEVEFLMNEPVLAKDDPSQPGPGVDFMLEVYRRRTADLASPIEESVVRELAYRSGGRLRDFVKLVRELAGQVLLRGAEKASAEDLEAALREQRLLLEAGLNTEHLAALREVMDDPKHRLPPGPVGYELLRTHRLLPYPDGSEWYSPHALLLKGDLLEGARPLTTGSGASRSTSSSARRASSCSSTRRATPSSETSSARFIASTPISPSWSRPRSFARSRRAAWCGRHRPPFGRVTVARAARPARSRTSPLGTQGAGEAFGVLDGAVEEGRKREAAAGVGADADTVLGELLHQGLGAVAGVDDAVEAAAEDR